MQNLPVKQILIQSVISSFDNASFLDKNNILWKIVNDKYIGKRSVWCYDYTACWIEDTKLENIKSYWCGKDADYNEIFTK